MAKYCEIARKVTNCTDNCKTCLEEEEKVRDIKVGDKVRYKEAEAILLEWINNYNEIKSLIKEEN